MTACHRLGCPPPHGAARSHCGGCHETFSTAKSFEKHQTFPESGSLTCHNPASRGLVARTDAAGTRVWGWPDSHGDRSWVSALRDENPATAQAA